MVTSAPVCCPSRAVLLTGRHVHNLRHSKFIPRWDCNSPSSPCACMRVNTSSSNNDFWQRHYSLVLQRRGFATAYFGKMLNPGGMQGQ
mmetsp:Transcript_20940/g.51182  ORF Transcript_20940/g.51182 Transcript_20940/m.51182 type:complete len:88 (-) Transcript_20940:151-414(-)